MNKAILALQVTILSLVAQFAWAADTTDVNAASSVSPAEKAAQRGAAFNAADTNGDGGLSEEELSKTEPTQFKALKNNFKEMDADKDGKITIKEANKWMTAQRYKFGK
jgi:Ca2+-binding EF-hand superfamily protein